MVTRTKDQNSLSLGDWNALCDVCGFKFKSCDLKKRWDGLYVCKEDWEPRHESDFYKAPKEDPSTPWQRPEDGGQQADDANTDVEGNTFPETDDPQGTKTAVPSGTFDGSL